MVTVAEISEVVLAGSTLITLVVAAMSFLVKIGLVYDRMSLVGEKVNKLDEKVSEQSEALALHGQTMSHVHAQLSDELVRIRVFVGMQPQISDSPPGLKRLSKGRKGR